MVSLFRAEPATAAAQRLERLAQGGATSDLPPAVADLQRELNHLSEFLARAEKAKVSGSA